jgi:hypothetical protein
MGASKRPAMACNVQQWPVMPGMSTMAQRQPGSRTLGQIASAWPQLEKQSRIWLCRHRVWPSCIQFPISAVEFLLGELNTLSQGLEPCSEHSADSIRLGAWEGAHASQCWSSDNHSRIPVVYR